MWSQSVSSHRAAPAWAAAISACRTYAPPCSGAESRAFVQGGGGYNPVGQVFKVAGQAVATEAERCGGDTDEIAFFNLGSKVELVSG